MDGVRSFVLNSTLRRWLAIWASEMEYLAVTECSVVNTVFYPSVEGH
jgi:hypothetical protein